jgi:hypothetical protein
VNLRLHGAPQRPCRVSLSEDLQAWSTRCQLEFQNSRRIQNHRWGGGHGVAQGLSLR